MAYVLYQKLYFDSEKYTERDFWNLRAYMAECAHFFHGFQNSRIPRDFRTGICDAPQAPMQRNV